MKQVRLFSVLVLVALSLMFSGCPKKTETSAIPEGRNQEMSSASQPAAPETDNRGQREKAVTEEQGVAPGLAGNSSPGLQSIYFDYDKTFIRTDARSMMASNAAWLKSHPKAKIRIEGDCDERGTSEYNQALGQRRATAAKKYLVDLGIAGSRITLISYGKEKPVCRESTDACWQKNRRDDFLVSN
jgi:peptidoglycan-associated lipoprotein